MLNLGRASGTGTGGYGYTRGVTSEDDRYFRHTLLPEIGPGGQARLRRSTVLVVGCGALGSMAAQVLVRAGVGRVRVADTDRVELHNLHRQILYLEEDVACGRSKAEIAAARLREMNGEVTVEAANQRAAADTIERLLDGVDLVVDGSDNFATRYLLNRVCVARGLPWIHGGVVACVGMTLTVLPGRGPCYACLYPEPPTDEDLVSTERLGVLSTAPLVVGALQATEALKVLVGASDVTPRLVTVDVWSQVLARYEVRQDPGCPVCAEGGRGSGGNDG